MKIEIIDLVIFGNFVIIGLIVASIFTDISNKRKMVVEGHADRLDRIEGIFIMIAIIGMLVAVWGALKLPRNANGVGQSLRDSYIGSWIRDKFIKKD